ncbi:MAG: hypothetical protein M1833_004077 [Piccolia ochrophora]|nr:MAG: hypothetical protein M1833_004077 [Piccolia ochrophora]
MGLEESAPPAFPSPAPPARREVAQGPITENINGLREGSTAGLGPRLGFDAAAAVCAGALVAPIITVIDRGIIENASGRNGLMPSIRSSLKQLVLRPHTFMLSKPFRLIFLVYTSTYLTANTIDTITSLRKGTRPTTVTAGPAKFIATSSVNASLSIYKDSRLARLFGPINAVPRPVPPASYALFAARDALTIFASFNLPPILAQRLPEGMGVGTWEWDRLSIAQFVAPAAIQVFSTPLHLLGLDLYNRPKGSEVEWRGRMEKVWRDWGRSCVARVGRIVPAFGVGGVVNMRARRALMERLEG